MIYLIIFIFILFCSYYYDYKKNTKNRNNIYIFILITLILLAGLRYRIGLDTLRYMYSFSEIPELYNISNSDFVESKYDPLYLILSSVSKTISSDFWVLQFIHAVFVNTVVFLFIKKNTKNIFCGLLFYYSFLYISFMCEVMREACAVSMFLLGYEYLKKDKLVFFTLFCFFAFLFHTSAILLLIIPILIKLKLFYLLKIEKSFLFVLTITLFLGYYIQTFFFDYLSIFYISERFSDKVDRYSDSALAGQTFSFWGVLSTFVRFIIIPFFLCLTYKIRYMLNKKMESFFCLYLLFAILTIPITILYRYNNYFYPFALIVMSNIMFSDKILITRTKFISIKSYLAWIFVISPMFVLQFYGYTTNVKETTLYKEYMRYYPYSSIITKEKDENRERLYDHFDIYY